MKGNPLCELCNGAGGYRVGRAWYRCACTRPNKAAAAAFRHANARPDGQPLSITEMLRQGTSSNRRADGR